MKSRAWGVLILLLTVTWLTVRATRPSGQEAETTPERETVVFWHFWGGEDRAVVEEIVARFNQSQDAYRVRAIAMPGNNLDVKLFLAVAGGDPPDLINQDDPIVGDWAWRDAITPLSEIAPPGEVAELNQWLLPAARQLVTYDGQMYGLCNGLDIRALYYNRTMLEHFGLAPPETLGDLDRIATTISPVDDEGTREYFGYLPDSRRLWAWGYVFGGRFYDPVHHRATLDHPQTVSALTWMIRYSQRYGVSNLAAFRTGDQSLPGKTFPLLPHRRDSQFGRYAVIMDGQWRIRDIEAFSQQRRQSGLKTPEFGACPLPSPTGGRQQAGWVNGNFFLVPRGASCPRGAWEFMKFWSGFHGHEAEAADTCIRGGWIPVSQKVIDQPAFQQHLQSHPLMKTFVDLAASSNQFPIPVIPGATYFNREVKAVAEQAMASPHQDPAQALENANRRIQQQLDRLRSSKHATQ